MSINTYSVKMVKTVLKMSVIHTQGWIQLSKEVRQGLEQLYNSHVAIFLCLLKSMSSQWLIKQFPIISFQ